MLLLTFSIMSLFTLQYRLHSYPKRPLWVKPVGSVPTIISPVSDVSSTHTPCRDLLLIQVMVSKVDKEQQEQQVVNLI